MGRPFSLLAAGLVALAASELTAQVGLPHPNVRSWVTVRLEGKPVASPQGALMLDPHPNLAAVRSCFWLLPPGDAPNEMLWAQQSRLGTLIWNFAETPRPGAACLFAGADKPRLGTLLPRLLPGEALRAELAPMAIVEAPDCVLFATAEVDGRRIALPPMPKGPFPLPPARYELWLVGDGRAACHHLELAAGATVALGFDGPSVEIERTVDSLVVPARRPDAVLLGIALGTAGRRTWTLFGDAVRAPLTTLVEANGLLIADRTLPKPADDGTVLWPPRELVEAHAAIDVPVVLDAAARGGHVRGFVVRRKDNGGWRVLGASCAEAVDRKATLRLPGVEGGDDWLLVVAEGLAPAALPLGLWQPGSPVELDRGSELAVTCIGEDGAPRTDVRLEYLPARADAALAVAHSDHKGRARFGRIGVPGRILVSDPRWLNAEYELRGPIAEPIRVELEAGAKLDGKVQHADGTPAASAMITLRDTWGVLRPRTRTVTTDADGAFVFGGLPEDVPLLLFATLQRDARTSSGKRRAYAGLDPVQLTIRDEDPVQPGR